MRKQQRKSSVNSLLGERETTGRCMVQRRLTFAHDVPQADYVPPKSLNTPSPLLDLTAPIDPISHFVRDERFVPANGDRAARFLRLIDLSRHPIVYGRVYDYGGLGYTVESRVTSVAERLGSDLNDPNMSHIRAMVRLFDYRESDIVLQAGPHSGSLIPGRRSQCYFDYPEDPMLFDSPVALGSIMSANRAGEGFPNRSIWVRNSSSLDPLSNFVPFDDEQGEFNEFLGYRVPFRYYHDEMDSANEPSSDDDDFSGWINEASVPARLALEMFPKRAGPSMDGVYVQAKTPFPNYIHPNRKWTSGDLSISNLTGDIVISPRLYQYDWCRGFDIPYFPFLESRFRPRFEVGPFRYFPVGVQEFGSQKIFVPSHECLLHYIIHVNEFCPEHRERILGYRTSSNYDAGYRLIGFPVSKGFLFLLYHWSEDFESGSLWLTGALYHSRPVAWIHTNVADGSFAVENLFWRRCCDHCMYMRRVVRPTPWNTSFWENLCEQNSHDYDSGDFPSPFEPMDAVKDMRTPFDAVRRLGVPSVDARVLCFHHASQRLTLLRVLEIKSIRNPVKWYYSSMAEYPHNPDCGSISFACGFCDIGEVIPNCVRVINACGAGGEYSCHLQIYFFERSRRAVLVYLMCRDFNGILPFIGINPALSFTDCYSFFVPMNGFRSFVVSTLRVVAGGLRGNKTDLRGYEYLAY